MVRCIYEHGECLYIDCEEGDAVGKRIAYNKNGHKLYEYNYADEKLQWLFIIKRKIQHDFIVEMALKLNQT